MLRSGDAWRKEQLIMKGEKSEKNFEKQDEGTEL